MLFRKEFLDGIKAGTVTLAFRRWRRPTVRAGGTLRTPIGEVQISAVTRVPLESIREQEAHRAGFDTLKALLTELNRRKAGEIYRIELGALRPDPRIALRDRIATGDELEELLHKLQRFDSHASGPAWSRRVLTVLRDHPGVRAGDLCELVGQEKAHFKRNVRKLKNLGLTESLGTGYRLSPRGAAFLDGLNTDGKPESK